VSLTPGIDNALLRRFTARTRLIVWTGMAVTAAAAWALLIALAMAEQGGTLLTALCSPDAAAFGVQSLAAGFVMWAAMSLAMMLPTAAPMISVYMDIAETASARRKGVVPASVLAGGYLTVWLGFSLAAAALQAGLRAAGVLDLWQGSLDMVLAGVVLIMAGAYQFTPLKQACLSKCQNPMPFFLTNWTDKPAGVFRLGLKQGLWCLGCCWALMLVAFATGLMNLVWMACLGLVMMAEKLYAESRALSLGAGVIFVAGGVAVLAAGLAG